MYSDHGPLIRNTDDETEQLLLAQCFERMKSLELHVDLSEMTPFFGKSPLHSAPRLTHLVLVPRDGFKSNYRVVVGRCLVSFLSNHCPNLVLLKLGGWDELFGFVTLPPTLNALHLHDSRWQAEGAFTLDCISPLKRLRVLDIRGAYLSKPIYRSFDNSSGRLELPCLDTLYFATAHIQSIQRVLSELDTAPLVSLHVEGEMLLLTHSLDQLCSTLGTMSQPAEGAADVLLITFGAFKLITEWSRSWISSNRPVHVFLSLDLPGRRNSPRINSSMRAIYVRLCKALTSRTLTQIKVKHHSPLHNLFQAGDWQEAFGSPALEKLTGLVVQGSPSIWDLINALSESYEAFDDENAAWLGPAHKPYFPALKYLTLREADLKNNTASTPLNVFLNPQERDVNLRDMLMARQSMGVQIEELTLDECEGLEAKDYDALRTMVHRLHVPVTGEEVMKRIEGLFSDQ
ncbi:hypothetical protein DL96DRAFT_1685854 [Flagelloscypha sp. PMI_526]|nr:hypothetical protein DL96DRAFT_1685854 [Flagelloscypha sp. PMI_526]